MVSIGHMLTSWLLAEPEGDNWNEEAWQIGEHVRCVWEDGQGWCVDTTDNLGNYILYYFDAEEDEANDWHDKKLGDDLLVDIGEVWQIVDFCFHQGGLRLER
jgi:hypothetical protein